ncbi:MAG: ATP-binding protein [Armatimonadota bacterium]|nr:ATP-binding protein [Armatimonadota bacterium]MDW8155654.1 ATP-binding protein [Armatimonadota bacterium]
MSLRDLLTQILEEREGRREPEGPPEVRLAVYDSPLAEPRVISLSSDDFHDLVGKLAAATFDHAQRRGGRIPYVVIREIVENLIHAYFRSAVISISEDGNTIRISDQGPGIPDKERALQPGFTTATPTMRRYIRGVGSGLPVAREQLSFLGGAITIEDNLNGGTVVTLRLQSERAPAAPGASAQPGAGLTERQRRVLLLVAEMGSAGPTAVARELGISLSTAYRELAALEAQGLLRAQPRGRRTLTEQGVRFVDELFRAPKP